MIHLPLYNKKKNNFKMLSCFVNFKQNILNIKIFDRDRLSSKASKITEYIKYILNMFENDFHDNLRFIIMKIDIYFKIL